MRFLVALLVCLVIPSRAFSLTQAPWRMERELNNTVRDMLPGRDALVKTAAQAPSVSRIFLVQSFVDAVSRHQIIYTDRFKFIVMVDFPDISNIIVESLFNTYHNDQWLAEQLQRKYRATDANVRLAMPILYVTIILSTDEEFYRPVKPSKETPEVIRV
jgi:hypothetical protein